jgi:hypothetical protein
MLKSIRYSFLFFAAFVVLLHNIIPHVHEEKLSEFEDQKFHEKENTLPFGLLVLAFHEFTEDGQMEDFVSQHHHINLDFNVVKELISSFKYFSLDVQSIIFESSLHKFEQLIFNESIDLDTGIRTSWGVRPPPVA